MSSASAHVESAPRRSISATLSEPVGIAQLLQVRMSWRRSAWHTPGQRPLHYGQRADPGQTQRCPQLPLHAVGQGLQGQLSPTGLHVLRHRPAVVAGCQPRRQHSTGHQRHSPGAPPPPGECPHFHHRLHRGRLPAHLPPIAGGLVAHRDDRVWPGTGLDMPPSRAARAPSAPAIAPGHAACSAPRRDICCARLVVRAAARPRGLVQLVAATPASSGGAPSEARVSR